MPCVPASALLAAPLADIIQDDKSNESKKIAACDVAAAFAVRDPTVIRELEKRAAVPTPVAASNEQSILLAKQQANVAAALCD